MKYKETCSNCENWNLYCKLGKEEYYWCRIYNWNRFELKNTLKLKILRQKHLEIRQKNLFRRL